MDFNELKLYLPQNLVAQIVNTYFREILTMVDYL